MTLFSPDRFPAAVQPALQTALDRLLEAVADAGLSDAVAALDATLLRQLEACFLASDYVAGQLTRFPALILGLLAGLGLVCANRRRHG